jgi:hypothetical protein
MKPTKAGVERKKMPLYGMSDMEKSPVVRKDFLPK